MSACFHVDEAAEFRLMAWGKIVEGCDTFHDGGERGGNLRIAAVCDVHFAMDSVVVNLGVKCFLDLSGVAREFDIRSTFGNRIDPKSMIL